MDVRFSDEALIQKYGHLLNSLDGHSPLYLYGLAKQYMDSDASKLDRGVQIACHRLVAQLQLLRDLIVRSNLLPAPQETVAPILSCEDGFVLGMAMRWDACDICGRPAWEHDGESVPASSTAECFSLDWTCKPWDPDRIAHLRSRYERVE